MGMKKYREVDLTEKYIEEMAYKAIKSGKGFEFMLYWHNIGDGWEKKAKKIFQKVLRRYI